MKKILSTLILAALGTAAFAQPGGPAPFGINAALLNFFGTTRAFSSKADVRLTDKAGKEISRLPMQMFLLDGKMRAEMDLSLMKGGQMPPEATLMLKQAGMDKMVSVILPDRQVTLVIYPGMQAYAEVPMTKEESSSDKDVKIEKTAAGQETIDGHPCVKNKISITDAKGKTTEGMVWNASDLKDFPLRVEMKEKDNLVTIQYTEPKFDKPETKLFEAPAGFTKHANVQQMMQTAMMKLIGGGK